MKYLKAFIIYFYVQYKVIIRYFTLHKRVVKKIVEAETEYLRLEIAKNKGHYSGSKLGKVEEQQQRLRQIETFLQQLL